MDTEETLSVYTTEYPSAKNEKILPSATTWMDLEGMLGEISQVEKDKFCFHLYMDSKK